jgi:metacaspase-1
MKKHALLVGINDYKGVNDLQGCVNDVTNVRSVLKTFFGFANSEIMVLTDSRATKENILTRLNAMVKNAETGDCLIFHFSGHGSQIRDREGDELADHMDELICPYDMDWEDGYITDDTMREILQQLKKGVRMEILLDSCHSGTGTRDLVQRMDQGEFLSWQAKSRYMPPPVDIECRHLGEEETLGAPKSFRTDREITLNHILWAGCKDNQTSDDAMIDGHYNGAFSYYFCKHVRESGGNISRADLYTWVKNSLKFNNFSQVPQLECKDAFKKDNVFK